MDLIPIHGAELHYDPHFLDPEEATELFNTLLTKCAWTRHKASFGHAVPRDEAYYGDPGTQYTYSRRQYKPFLDTGIALAERPRRRLDTTPYSAICIGMEMTASVSMPMPSRRWGL